METIKAHLPWMIPLLMTLLMGSFQMYSLIDRVATLEENGRTRGEAAILQLQEVDNRVKRLEEFCCGEVEKFKYFIDGQYKKKEEN